MAVRRRGSAWSDAETLTLLSIWEDNGVEEQLESPKANNTSIYRTISAEMTDKGYERTPEQCKVRMHTLKRSYRQCKGKMKKSGKGRNTCKYFEQLDAILGTRPASSPVKVIESGYRKRNTDSSSSGEESCDDGHEIERHESEEQSPETENQNVDVANDVTDPQTEETAEETPVTGNKKQEEPPKASKRKDLKDREQEHSKIKKDSKGKKAKKSRLEVALGAVMEGFSSTNEKSEDKFLELEKNKLEIEKKRIELEKTKLESEERQKREERQHQFNMMNLIMGMVSGQRPPGHNSSVPQSSQFGGPGPMCYVPPSPSTPYISPTQDSASMKNVPSNEDSASSYYNL
jgi:ATP-dependent NAD(P)H-hydrate dehydratase